MGVVYRARQLSLNRVVALKTIRGGLPESEWRRLRVEAETVANLHHPNIVQVYDLAEHAGLQYIVMEYVEGGSLDRVLQGSPQPPRLAAELLEQVARALALAHERGIVHRDVKPANILLAPPAHGPKAVARKAPTAHQRYGVPKVTDFGL